MKIIITGSLGHISKPLTEMLVQKKHAVTVISSNPGKQKDIEALGATAAIGYVASEELICNEIAGILGAEIGKPDMKWITISDEEMQSGLNAVGMNKGIVAGLVKMNASMHTGKLFEDYYRNKPVLGKIKLTEFAKEFAAAFKE